MILLKVNLHIIEPKVSFGILTIRKNFQIQPFVKHG